MLGALEANLKDLPLFILCASTAGDSLSQWRAYGAGQGYAVAMESAAGAVPLGVLVPEAQYEPAASSIYPAWQSVTYNDSEKRMKMHSTLVRALTWGRDAHLEEGSELRSLLTYQDIATLKHSGFEDEREVRFMAAHPSLDQVFSVRAGRYGLTPYVRIGAWPSEMLEERFIMEPSPSFLATTPDVGAPLPITEVRVGPSPHMETAERGLRRALDRFGYGHVRTSLSAIPYR
nr:DUF2971 domain-containing protein [Kineococcus vitellinus]